MGKGKGKGKGKKGKGKGRAAPLSSNFWDKKLDSENRTEMDGEFAGTIARYNFKFVYGLILPDTPGELPGKVKNALAKSAKEKKAEGKDICDKNAIYFRKPDVVHDESFKLSDGAAVSFKVYVDNRGAGAFDVSQA